MKITEDLMRLINRHDDIHEEIDGINVTFIYLNRKKGYFAWVSERNHGNHEFSRKVMSSCISINQHC